ncbi:MAG: hypothetical protein IT552_02405 [Sphingomonadaceae bacterium]|nr:hypothetical protein [Sphingomonadaceae bacterium]
MTTDYGFGASIEAHIERFEMHSRQTGRTHAMLSAMKDGDTVFTNDIRKARYLEERAREMGKNIKARVLRPGPNADMSRLFVGRGTTYFDHSWYLEFWTSVIASNKEQLAYIHANVNLGKPAAPRRKSDRMTWGEK